MKQRSKFEYDTIEKRFQLIGKRIAHRRRELNITQKQLGDAVNVSNSHISLIENGEKNPSFETLLLISKYLGVTLDYLTYGTLYIDIDDEIIEKLQICSIENRKRFSIILDGFIDEDKLVK